MNKTVTAHISGIIFHIETDAYEKLNRYLSTIRNYFNNSDGEEEIMADIEARIAELFKDRLKNEREVITMLDVENVIAIMGEPEQYMEADPDAEYSNHKSNNSGQSEKFYTKKLFRDPDDKVLGGVCSGIGYYFGIERIWLRAAFLIAFFAFGVGFIPYIILWIIMPIAKTAGDKLEMKGEPVTVDNIGRTIKDEFSNLKKKVNGGRYNESLDSAGNILTRILSFLAKVIVFLFNFIIKLIAVILIFVAGIALLTFITSFFAIPGAFKFSNNGFEYIFQREILELVLLPGFLYYFSIVGLFLFVAIPLIALIYAGLKLMLNFRVKHRIPGIILGSLWGISIVMLLVSAFYISREFNYHETDTETIVLNQIQGDTIYLGALKTDDENKNAWSRYKNSSIMIEDDKVVMGSASVDVIASETDNFELYINRKSKGSSRKAAQAKLENIEYSYEVSDSLLLINEFISFPKTDMFRDQELKFRIGIPYGKVIFLRSDSKEIIYDIDNVTNTWDPKMVGHYWQMKPEGLTCLDCSWSKENEIDSTDSIQDTITKKDTVIEIHI